ncbi:hypothetical protein [Marinobacterium lutimaris]|uniref:Uncharacterized protein n=1 Tax=Marinobacterium lutimaris TaxID=568106 RepID=A0A1H5TZ60_9GAMM|nr:hypothetical protein [Marinobacterium lutimaris]SEF67287.1 hypothetical protein SAMN05444390_101194 [Marinobacterium lutimaris]
MKWVLLVLSLLTTLAAAEEPQKKPLQFHLCPAFVEQVSMGEPNSFGWPVFVKLTPAGSQSFETLTQHHIGKKVEILAGGQTFFRATFLRVTISAAVSSGVLQQAFSSQEIAHSWLLMLERLPMTPCGPTSADQAIRDQAIRDQAAMPKPAL